MKLHVREGTGKILGATVVARHAGDPINEIVADDEMVVVVTPFSRPERDVGSAPPKTVTFRPAAAFSDGRERRPALSSRS